MRQIDQLLQELPLFTKENIVESYYTFMRENNFPSDMSLVKFMKTLAVKVREVTL